MIHRAREPFGTPFGTPFGRKSSLLELPNKAVTAATWFSHSIKSSAQHRASFDDEAMCVCCVRRRLHVQHRASFNDEAI
jgi:hypothetical protein